jgi:hypothetical protein
MVSMKMKSPNRTAEWEDILKDLLELRTSLSENECTYLIRSLKRYGIKARKVLQPFAFSVGGTLILIGKGLKAKEFWCYEPCDQTAALKRVSLNGAKRSLAIISKDK